MGVLESASIWDRQSMKYDPGHGDLQAGLRCDSKHGALYVFQPLFVEYLLCVCQRLGHSSSLRCTQPSERDSRVLDKKKSIFEAQATYCGFPDEATFTTD